MLSFPYYKRMKIQNKLLNKNAQEPVNSLELSYVLNTEQVDKSVGMASDISSRRIYNVFEVRH